MWSRFRRLKPEADTGRESADALSQVLRRGQGREAVSECAFCLVDLPTDSDSEWCGAPCKAAWTALFGRQKDAPPPEDVYDDESDTLPLDH